MHTRQSLRRGGAG
ncbi:hypothetical protein YPPY102_4587, partial [Yersinia pestis PY-102]